MLDGELRLVSTMGIELTRCCRDVVSPLVTGVPGAIHRRTATVALGIARMETALEHGSAAVIYM